MIYSTIVSKFMQVSQSAKDLFDEENVNTLIGLVDVVGPHILFQIGPIAYAMPVLGWDLQSGAAAKSMAAA